MIRLTIDRVIEVGQQIGKHSNISPISIISVSHRIDTLGIASAIYIASVISEISVNSRPSITLFLTF